MLSFAAVANATQYPPGPGGAFPDTLIKVSFIQNPASVPFPVQPDTVWGIAGIITGFDPIPTGFAIYIQNSQGGPWSGVDVFTGGSNYISGFAPPLAIGDSIVSYGRLEEFGGETELRGFAASSFNPPLPIVRRVSIGNALPPFKVGTVAELQELPTNPQAEQWEGCLVRVNGPLRVARQTGLGVGAVPGANFLAVNNTLCPPASPGPCDSLFIDTATLSNLNAPAVGSVVTSVQGIYNQRARGYRIQTRDGQDIVDTSPPNVSDAFPVEDNQIRVIFDRNVTAASAQNTANYSLGSLRTISGAVQVSPTTVVLTISPVLPDGGNESVTINNIVSSSNGVPMTIAQNKEFINGVLTSAFIQAADPAALGGNPCDDRSSIAGPGGIPGPRMTVRGVVTLTIGSTSWIEDAAGGQRSGVAVFAPIGPMVLGRQYLVAGAVQEFFTETEIVSNVFLVDEGAAAIPAPQVQTVGVLRDTLCDATGTVVNGEDYEGVLVRMNCVQVDRTGLAGENFRVTGPYPTFSDTILVDNDVATLTYAPVRGQMINVTGVMDVSFNTFRIQPRSDADIVQCTTAGVDEIPTAISFSIYPNPSRSPRVAFGLPRSAKVDLSVYDLLGRKLTTLAQGEMPAGQYTKQWNGRLADGSDAGSGVFFYRLRVGSETFNLRAVRMD